MARSVLDDLGEEVTGIVAPVSICMALTLALVRILNPEGESDSNSVFLASAYYTEHEGDTAGQKLGGAVINALIFVGVVAAMTFALVLLFKHGYVKVIYAYMMFAGFSVFFVLAGLIAIQLLQRAHVHTDFVSFAYILSNFAAVGSLTLFFFPAPLLMKQAYLIITGVVTAYVFTWIPEWTTWVLLVAMAVYDVVAVLVPGGPLKMLVELAQEREETIPALVYEARPVRRAPLPQPRSATEQGGGAGLAPLAVDGSDTGGQPLQAELPERAPLPRQMRQELPDARPLATAAQPSRPRPLSPARGVDDAVEEEEGAAADADTEALLPRPSRLVAAELEHAQGGEDDDEDLFSLPDSIKLGLGDFIFYSLCLSRSAFSGWAAAFATYLAILAGERAACWPPQGLGCTLLWLATAHRALPALPISITLGVTCFVLTKLVLEAVCLPASLALVYF